MRLKYRFRTLIATLALVSALGAPMLTFSMASAHNGESGSGTSGSGRSADDSNDSSDDSSKSTETEVETEHGVTTIKNSDTSSNRKSGSEREKSSGSSNSGTKLSEVKLKVCKKRETKVNNIMARIADRGQKHIDLYTSVADKTMAFYEEKGNVLSNYDALVADVETKKAAAQAEVDTLQSTSVTFTCDGTDPKGAAESFKTALKTEISALKDYKTAVKNLIKGVKSVQPDDNSSDRDQ